MNTEKYNINLVIDDHNRLKYNFFDNISIWEEITQFVPIFINTALELNCGEVNIYFNNLNSLEKINSKTNEYNKLEDHFNNYYNFTYGNYNLHETFSNLFNSINSKYNSNHKEYIVLITDCVDEIEKILECKNYIGNLKYIRILLFSTKTNIKLKDPTIKIFNRNYLLSDKTQTIFTLTS
jgi:hypothetical protein